MPGKGLVYRFRLQADIEGGWDIIGTDSSCFLAKRNIYLHMQIDPRYQNDVDICLEDSIQKLIR
jgi:hypothetical protein